MIKGIYYLIVFVLYVANYRIISLTRVFQVINQYEYFYCDADTLFTFTDAKIFNEA
jgi:hypothetical protein